MKPSFTSKSSILLLAWVILFSTGCTAFRGNMQEGIELNKSRHYKEAAEIFSAEIHAATTPESAAMAYKYRAIARTGMKDYREAFSDLQIAWKISCTLAPKFPPPANATSPQYEDCNRNIPKLIEDLRPFLSDFAAIMATQEAAKTMKRRFPAFAD